MESPISDRALRRLRRFHRGYKPLVLVEGKLVEDSVLAELATAGFIRKDLYSAAGMPVPESRYILSDKGQTFLDNWQRSRGAYRASLALSIPALLISAAALLVSILK